MLNFTRIAAIEFFYKDRRFIRVYYQDADLIKESCYNDDDGWYTLANDVVARDVRDASPLTATNWENGTQIRVYYVDKSGQLKLRVRKTESAGEEAEWVTDPQLPETRPSSVSQLSAARTDEGDANIHICFQDDTNAIKELVYVSDDNTWYEQEVGAEKVLPGTSLSLITGDGQLRLFYQDTQNTIKERYSDTETDWRDTKIAPYKLPANAPISAVAWNYGAKNFQVRVYSLNTEYKVVEMIYRKERGGWEKNMKVTSETVLASAGSLSDVSAVRVDDGTVSIFYQPARNIIGQYSVTASGRIPLGIPTTGMTNKEKMRVEAEKKQQVQEEKKVQLAQATTVEEKKAVEAAQEQQIQEKIKEIGMCSSGFPWKKEANGYRCAGGGHFVGNLELQIAP